MLLLVCAAANRAQTLRNQAYAIAPASGGGLTIEVAGAPGADFRAEFIVLFRRDDPKVRMVRRRVDDRLPSDEYGMPVPVWDADTNPYEAGEAVRVRARASRTSGSSMRFEFAPERRFRLSAGLELPPGAADPVLRWELTPVEAGWYSVAFVGAPEAEAGAVDFAWQPLAWHEKRFPSRPLLTLEHVAPTPAVLASAGGAVTAVTPDPALVPFRMPVFREARFGLVLRNASGRIQPVLFAPVMGLADSHLEAGRPAAFACRIVRRAGTWYDTFRHIAQAVDGFRDYRENGTCSLNETLENMIDFAMHDYYGGWKEEYRGFDYGTEIAGNVKVVSALHPWSAALATDSEEIYRRRALPTLEFMMSREKFGFSSREDTRDHEGPSYYLRGPGVEAGDAAAAYALGLRRSDVFLSAARALYAGPVRELNLSIPSPGKTWVNALELYRATGERQYLDEARQGADEYLKQRVDRPQRDFDDVRIPRGGQFWSDYFPKWKQLLELYEDTRDPRYLEGAVAGARLFSTVIWTNPMPPVGEVTVNAGGKVGLYERGRKRLPGSPLDLFPPAPIEAPEQRVPAWRVAQAGLAPESLPTSEINPAVLLAMHAPYFLRLAHYSGDSFFADLARAAVIGRYASYPGYDINYEFTTVYQRPDYLLRQLAERSYNNVYYNHVWPQIAMLLDYLAADAFYRSRGRIEFPAEHVEGYAYLQARAYGHRPGKFAGDSGVRLWLPRKLCRIDSVQANYVAGYGNGNLYLALMNQSARAHNATVTLNADAAPYDAGREYKVRVEVDGEARGSLVLRNGSVTAPLSPKGITSIVIEGLAVRPAFQEKALAQRPPLGPGSHHRWDTAFGPVNAMLIDGGQGLTSGYVYLTATEKQVREARLSLKRGSEWTTTVDSRYPYEFSFLAPEGGDPVEFRIEAVDASGARLQAGPMRLERGTNGASR